MIIPNAERAVVDIRKLRDYCLNPLHDDGKHKAQLFAAVGIIAMMRKHYATSYSKWSRRTRHNWDDEMSTDNVISSTFP